MLTKAGKYFLGQQTGFASTGKFIPQVNPDSVTKTTFKFKDTSGTEYYWVPKCGYYQDALRLSMDNSNGGFAFGTGATAATENDYTLESVITTGLTASVVSSTEFDATNNSYFSRLTITVNNTSAADITINEIGMYRGCAYGNSIGVNGSSIKCVLIDRTVLETPVVVPAGEASVIRYDFVYPSSAT